MMPKVYGKCKKCSAEIAYKTDVNTRVEFAMQHGENIVINCKHCNTRNNCHVDDLFANPSKTAQIIASLVLVVGTPLAFFFINPIFESSKSHYVIYVVGGFLLVPIFVYILLNKQDQTRVSDFNRRKLKGRIHNI